MHLVVVQNILLIQNIVNPLLGRTPEISDDSRIRDEEQCFVYSIILWRENFRFKPY